MKKVIITVIAMVMMFALTACNTETSTDTVMETVSTLTNQRNQTVDTIRDNFNSADMEEFVLFYAEVVDYEEGTIRLFMIYKIESEYGNYQLRIEDYDVDDGESVLVISKVVNDVIEGLDVVDLYRA